jgi:ABC-type histidine transport system ATPase subunit
VKISNELEHSIDCTRIVSMENMKILEEGRPEELLKNPKSKIGTFIII